jgi:hypothetical protein
MFVLTAGLVDKHQPGRINHTLLSYPAAGALAPGEHELASLEIPKSVW